jgi:hypothetical protein
MANELSFANLETDAGLAHYLAGMVRAKLADRTDLRGALDYIPFSAHMGSETVKVSQYNPAFTFAAASSEISGGASNSSIGSANFQLVVARRLLKFTMSDLWRIVAPTGSLNLDLLAQVINEAAGLTITDMVTTIFDDLANAVGSTTADMSIDYQYDAQFQLNITRTPGPYYMVLKPKAFNELQASIRGELGAIQWVPATAEMLVAKGPGFKGTLNGTEIWDCDAVDVDGGGTYYHNAMFGRGCFAYTEAPVADVTDKLPPQVFRIDAGNVLIVHEYDADNGITEVIGSYFPAVVETEDARGVEINSQVA